MNKRRLRESFHGSRPTGRSIKAPAKASGTLLSEKNVLLFPSIRAEIEETSVRVLQKYTFCLMPSTHFLKKTVSISSSTSVNTYTKKTTGMSGYQMDQGKLQSPGVTQYNDYVYYPLFSRLSCETEEKTMLSRHI